MGAVLLFTCTVIFLIAIFIAFIKPKLYPKHFNPKHNHHIYYHHYPKDHSPPILDNSPYFKCPKGTLSSSKCVNNSLYQQNPFPNTLPNNLYNSHYNSPNINYTFNENSYMKGNIKENLFGTVEKYKIVNADDYLNKTNKLYTSNSKKVILKTPGTSALKSILKNTNNKNAIEKRNESEFGNEYEGNKLSSPSKMFSISKKLEFNEIGFSGSKYKVD